MKLTMILVVAVISVFGSCTGVALANAGAGTSYTIRSGDSLERIARRHGCTVAALVAANGLQRDGIIHPGQKLRIPQPAAASSPASRAGVVRRSGSGAGTHTIAAGETFAAVSRAYGIPLPSLLAANPGVEPTRLREGQVIRLQAAATSTPGPSPTPAVARSVAAPPASPPVAATPPAGRNVSLAESVPAVPISTTSASGDTPAADSAAAETAAPAAGARVRSVMIESEVTFTGFATRYGTDPERLNDLNGLDLAPDTILAKGSELYVPAQP